MPEEQIIQTQENMYPGEVTPEIREMIEAGVFYGRKKSKTHPKMKHFVILNRGDIEILNLQKSAECTEKAADFLQEKIRQSGLALIVATQPSAEEAISHLVDKFNIPYVTTRWAGGTITNFGIISKRIERFKELREGLKEGTFEKYTKKERVVFEKELERLRELFGGLENMTRIPDVLIVIDPVMHKTAVSEALIKKIPIIALGNVDTDPETIDYLIPGNDNAKRSINWFLGKMEEAMSLGIKRRVEKKEIEKENSN